MARWIVSGSHTRYFTDVVIEAESKEEAEEKARNHFQEEMEDDSDTDIGSMIQCDDDPAEDEEGE